MLSIHRHSTRVEWATRAAVVDIIWRIIGVKRVTISLDLSRLGLSRAHTVAKVCTLVHIQPNTVYVRQIVEEISELCVACEEEGLIYD